MNYPKIVAECCCNHMGNINIAFEMIDKIAECKVPFAKFQKWNPSNALSEEQYNNPHPNPIHSFGHPYGIHRENLEFSMEEHLEIKNYCADKGVTYSCSVFDKVSAKEICSINPKYIKIPSQKNLRNNIYEIVCNEFEGQIHISTGMTTDEQVDKILNIIDQNGALNRIVLYATTSAYPCNYENLYLMRIKSFIKKYGKQIFSVGFSGHHNGIAADIAAITLGAKFVERHFTLDRTLKGTDHAASLEPQGLAKLSRDIKNVSDALKNRPDYILEVEQDAYDKVKKDDARKF